MAKAFSQEDLREFVIRRDFLTPRFVTPEERESLRSRTPISASRAKHLRSFMAGWRSAKGYEQDENGRWFQRL
jgi:hypothetical protein